MRDHSFDQRFGEFAHVRFDRAKFPEFIDPFRSFAMLKVAPEIILNRGLAGPSPFSHTTYLLRSFDMTLVISTAARAASVPRLISSSRQRARAWLSLSKLRTTLMTGTVWVTAMRCSASVTDWLRFLA